MIIDASTVLWWLRQDKAAQKQFSLVGEHEVVSIQSALHGFSDLAGSDGLYTIWGNGVMADNVWLNNAYDKVGIKPPWDYKQDRCYRTVKAMHPDIEQDAFLGVEHNALDDATHQAKHLIKIFKSYK